MLKKKQKVIPKSKTRPEDANQSLALNKLKDYRRYQNTFLQSQYCKKYIAQIPYKKTQAGYQSGALDQKAYQNRMRRLDSEYDIQSSIESDHVIKNLTRKFESQQMTIYQEYFDWYLTKYFSVLSELPLQNLNFTKRFKIFSNVVKGLMDLKSLKICHRALTPNCICLLKLQNSEYIAKITYFDQAIQLDSKNSIITIPANKTPFSAPQVKNRQPHTLKSDIWSLGLILNYLLYNTIQNTWQQHSQTKIEVPPGTPNWLLELLKSMLHQNPAKRPSIEGVMEIVRSSLRCIETLEKIVPVGSDGIGFERVESQFSQVL